MAQALRTQRRHLESSTALWTLSALALAASGQRLNGFVAITHYPKPIEIMISLVTGVAFGNVILSLIYCLFIVRPVMVSPCSWHLSDHIAICLGNASHQTGRAYGTIEML